MRDIELRPDLVERHVRLRAMLARGGSDFGIRTVARRGRPAWVLFEGANLLVRWSGEQLPLPRLADPGGRQCEIVGFAWPDADPAQVTTFSGLTNTPDTVYHYALLQVSGGGVLNSVRPFDVVTRTYDAAGDARGLMPNAPAQLDVRLVGANKPHVSWWYSSGRQQVAPAKFNVYVSDGSAFDFETPTGSVDFVDQQTRYWWTGDALEVGDVRYYTVRAESVGGVLSLIPRSGLCPSGDYDSVDLGRCPMARVPSGPPATIGGLWPEVMR